MKHYDNLHYKNGCDTKPNCEHPHNHCEPPKRQKPLWCGEVDTTKTCDHFDVRLETTCMPPHGYVIPHCSTHVPGESTQKQMQYLASQMNTMIDTLNDYNCKVWGAYDELVLSTKHNDAYYDEIWVEEGYLDTAGKPYKVIHIPFTDRCKNPILFELGLSYNNTTNSGITESAFHASKHNLADKLIPACNTGNGWNGLVTWCKAPVNSQPNGIEGEDGTHTFAVLKNGHFRVYPNTTSRETLTRDNVVNSMGCRGVLMNGNSITPDNFPVDKDALLSRVGVGQNYTTKERFIIILDGDTETGATSGDFAKLFEKYNCTVAVELASPRTTAVLDKGGFVFSPLTVDAQSVPTVPEFHAYWYITKKRNYKNEYVHDVARLTQLTNEMVWRYSLANDSIDNVKTDIINIWTAINNEIANRIEADDELKDLIEAEEEARIAGDLELLNKLNQEIEDRIMSDNDLSERISQEVDILNNKISQVQQNLDSAIVTINERITNEVQTLSLADVDHIELQQSGNKNTYTLYLKNSTNIDVAIETYDYDKLVSALQTLQQIGVNLDGEIAARIAGDEALRLLIEAETSARVSGDDILTGLITQLRTDFQSFITITDGKFDDVNGRIDTVLIDINNIKDRITVVEGQYNNLVQQMSALNQSITALQNAFAQIEISFESVKQTVSNLIIEINQFEDRIEARVVEIEARFDDYVKKTGDEMTGTLTVKGSDIKILDGQLIGNNNNVDLMDNGVIKIGQNDTFNATILRGVADPEQDVDAVNLRTLNDSIDRIDMSDYVNRTGDTMTGALTVDNADITVLNGSYYGNENMLDLSEPERVRFSNKYGGEDVIVSGVQDPRDDNDAVNKRFLTEVISDINMDDYYNKYGDTLQGPMDANKNGIHNLDVPYSEGDAVNLAYLTDRINEIYSDISHLQDEISARFRLTGDTLQGFIDVNHNPIKNIPIPVDGGDAIPLDYLTDNTSKLRMFEHTFVVGNPPNPFSSVDVNFNVLPYTTNQQGYPYPMFADTIIVTKGGNVNLKVIENPKTYTGTGHIQYNLTLENTGANTLTSLEIKIRRIEVVRF